MSDSGAYTTDQDTYETVTAGADAGGDDEQFAGPPSGVGAAKCGSGCTKCVRASRGTFTVLIAIQFILYAVRIGFIADKRQEISDRSELKAQSSFDRDANTASPLLLLFAELGTVLGLAMCLVSIAHVHRWHQYTRWASIGSAITTFGVDMLALGYACKSIDLGSPIPGEDADPSWNTIAALVICSAGVLILFQALLNWSALTENYGQPERFEGTWLPCGDSVSRANFWLSSLGFIAMGLYVARVAIAASLEQDVIDDELNPLYTNQSTAMLISTNLLAASIGSVFIVAAIWHFKKWTAVSKVSSSSIGMLAFGLDVWAVAYAFQSWSESDRPAPGAELDKRILALQILTIITVVVQALLLVAMQVLIMQFKESETDSSSDRCCAPNSRLIIATVTFFGVSLHIARLVVASDSWDTALDGGAVRVTPAGQGLLTYGLLSAVVGIGAGFASMLHLYKWSFGSACTSYVVQLTSYAWVVLSTGYACKQIHLDNDDDRYDSDKTITAVAALTLCSLGVDLLGVACNVFLTSGLNYTDESVAGFKGGPAADANMGGDEESGAASGEGATSGAASDEGATSGAASGAASDEGATSGEASGATSGEASGATSGEASGSEAGSASAS